MAYDFLNDVTDVIGPDGQPTKRAVGGMERQSMDVPNCEPGRHFMTIYYPALEDDEVCEWTLHELPRIVKRSV